jgi:pyochelin synthetase
VGRGEAGVLALEVARQLAESGVEVSRLAIVSPVDGGMYGSSPYAGDITLICPEDPDPAAVRWWRDVCLGEVAETRATDDPTDWAAALREPA